MFSLSRWSSQSRRSLFNFPHPLTAAVNKRAHHRHWKKQTERSRLRRNACPGRSGGVNTAAGGVVGRGSHAGIRDGRLGIINRRAHSCGGSLSIHLLIKQNNNKKKTWCEERRWQDNYWIMFTHDISVTITKMVNILTKVWQISNHKSVKLMLENWLLLF